MKPLFARPIAYQPGRVGESCYVALDRNERGVVQANNIIVRYNRWYDDLRRDYNPKGEKKS